MNSEEEPTSPSGVLGSPGTAIRRIPIAPEDRVAIQSLVDALVKEFPDFDSESDLVRLTVRSHQLPEAVRTALVEFRLLNKPSGGLVLSGLPIDTNRIGPTPQTHDAIEPTDEVRKATRLHLLLASLLGAPISQAAVRGGRMIVDICPVRGDETTQLASSSTGGLAWHNEDAHHELRADWIMLLCLRNPDAVATTFARVDDLNLAEDVKKKLYGKHFRVVADSSHMVDAEVPPKVAVLTGDWTSPFIRIDPAFMPHELQDEHAVDALEHIISALDRRLQDVVLEPGDMLIIDNRRTVHGRRPFTPRYDGTDRWLRVMNVAADLRPSDGQRTGPHRRAIQPHSYVRHTGA